MKSLKEDKMTQNPYPSTPEEVEEDRRAREGIQRASQPGHPLATYRATHGAHPPFVNSATADKWRGG